MSSVCYCSYFMFKLFFCFFFLYKFVYGLPLKFFSGVSQSSYVLLYLRTILHRKYNFLSEI